MSNDALLKQIKDVASVFNERERQYLKTKDSESHKRWMNTPIANNKLCESRHYKLTLWPGTNKQKEVVQTVSKFRYEQPKPLAAKYKAALSKDFNNLKLKN